MRIFPHKERAVVYSTSFRFQASRMQVAVIPQGGITSVAITKRKACRIKKKAGFAEEDYNDVFIILDKYDKIGEEGVKKEGKSFQ